MIFRLSLLLYCAMLLTAAAYAQDSKHPRNTWMLQATADYNLNEENLYRNRGYQPLKVQNTFGYSINVGFRHVTRYGFLIQDDIGYLYRTHSVKASYDLTNYNPLAMEALKKLSPYVVSFDMRAAAFTNKFWLGYLYSVPRSNYYIESRVGYSVQLDKDSKHERYDLLILYPLDNVPDQGMGSVLYHVERDFDSYNDHKSIVTGSPIRVRDNAYLYFGVGKKIPNSFITSYAVGAQITTAISHDPSRGIYLVSYDVSGKITGISGYYDKQVGVSLSLAAYF